MTNKERYKQAFSVLHTSDQFSVEVENMSRLNKKHNMKVAAAALAGCILLAGGIGTAYAANVGGIQRTVQVWLHGDQTTANMTVSDDGTYTIEYPDENGETREISGGGIAYEADGTERPLTGEELLEEANSPDVEYNDDGTVWLYYKNQKIEITDKFKDDVCYVKVQDGDETLYVTVKYQNGLAYSNEKYVEEDEFN